MKRVTMNRIGGKQDYFIYENEEEWNRLGIKAKTFANAQVGDYIKSDNGYYVPVVSIHKYPSPANTKTIIYKFFFPRQEQIVHIYKSSGDVQKMSFIYEINCKKQVKPLRQITTRVRLMFDYIAAGWDIMAAFDASYNIKGTFKKHQYLMKILSNPAIIDFLKEHKAMNKLKESFKSKGVTEEWLAIQCKDILEDKKAPAALRIKALESAREILSLQDRGELKSEANKGDAKLKIVQDLKEDIKKKVSSS